LVHWMAGWALCQNRPPTIRQPVLVEGSRSLLSQSHRRDCRRHHQNPTSHSRLRRLPATRQRSDQGCFVSFSCAYGVVLNRRRAPSSVAGAVVSLIKKVGEAIVFQEIVCLALFSGSGIHPLRRVSYLQANTDAHRLGLNGSARKIMPIVIPIKFKAAVRWRVTVTQSHPHWHGRVAARNIPPCTTCAARRVRLSTNFRRPLFYEGNNRRA
jgi:hypothetical protein